MSEQLDGNNSTRFECIVSDTCKCVYTTTLLDKVLTPRLKGRVNESVFREQVKLSGLEVWCCPSCAYLGFSEKLYKTMQCPECNVFYCTSCNEIDHGKRTCAEVKEEKERLKNPVHRAHEAMSKAVKRLCPTCAKEFSKADGCKYMDRECALSLASNQ